MANLEHIKQNNTAKEGDVILLSKPIGVGILATAQKRGVIADAHQDILVKQLTKLNDFGELLGKEKAVTGMTDITGFGLMGHLCEMCADTDLSAQINYNQIPVLEPALIYLKQNIIPDATYRNWNAYEKEVKNCPPALFAAVNDPQTNGGLMVAVDSKNIKDFELFCQQNRIEIYIIGKFKADVGVKFI